MAKRAFLIVLDSFGIGGAPDAAAFGDEGLLPRKAAVSLFAYRHQLEVPRNDRIP